MSDSRNGTRQPQEVNASPEMVLKIAKRAVARISPMATPSCGQLPNSPRRFWSPHSMDSSTEPLHSPPTAMPWKMRINTSSVGASTPRVAAPGRMPITVVDRPIISNVTMSIALRPIRSPQWPKMAAPIGRAANPTKYVVNEASSPT
jgi:hypothetical protein